MNGPVIYEVAVTLRWPNGMERRAYLAPGTWQVHAGPDGDVMVNVTPSPLMLNTAVLVTVTGARS